MQFLVTAFKPYDQWEQNSSWLALQRWLHDFVGGVDLITRLYPVDLLELESRLQQDLQLQPDAVLHVGQSPGSPVVAVEEIALNAAGMVEEAGTSLPPLVANGPVAYRTTAAAGVLAKRLAESGIPASVSYHAGTFLCNAVFYLSHHLLRQRGSSAPVVFLHLPLAVEQVVGRSGHRLASLPLPLLAQAIDVACAHLVEVVTGQVASRDMA
ncbi:MAG: peptidase C15 [Pirellulaceae bacterium]|nr:MAG: peptidase C15 [Pirellulaceae bacterium]